MKLTQAGIESRISAIEKGLATCQASDRRHGGAIQSIFINQDDTAARIDRLEAASVVLTLDDFDPAPRDNIRRRGQSRDGGSDSEQELSLGRTLADELSAFSDGPGQDDTIRSQGGTLGPSTQVASFQATDIQFFIPNDVLKFGQSYDEGSESDRDEPAPRQLVGDKIVAPSSDLKDSAC